MMKIFNMQLIIFCLTKIKLEVTFVPCTDEWYNMKLRVCKNLINNKRFYLDSKGNYVNDKQQLIEKLKLACKKLSDAQQFQADLLIAFDITDLFEISNDKEFKVYEEVKDFTGNIYYTLVKNEMDFILKNNSKFYLIHFAKSNQLRNSNRTYKIITKNEEQCMNFYFEIDIYGKIIKNSVRTNLGKNLNEYYHDDVIEKILPSSADENMIKDPLDINILQLI
ncbi:hypothetical protein TCON_0006 [Astathelohania contejeani]|uniref:Uncharacterized protein n=1 Tax=Astathelohania contejeani TaxID=164912 RepID=A0ABQ7I2X8_9MICR|nr:hypothetical protein TCON_0006 [Thelohania contejeani]